MFFAKTPLLLKKYYANLTWSIPVNDKRLFLTFDDGPTPEITNWVLDTLQEYNAKATFFCLGANIEKHPQIYQRIKTQHAIGNHSYSHLNGWKTKNETYFKDIEKCHQLTNALLFRPPYGRIKKSQIAYLQKKYKIIMWEVLSGDFDETISKEKCLKNVLTHTKNGSIIVFHDSIKAARNLKYALPKFLEHFSKKGFLFEIIS